MNNPNKVTLNRDGTMNIPDHGTKPMVGVDPAQLARKQQEHNERMAHLKRQMNSTFRCLECKRIWQGTQVRARVRTEGNTKMEVLVCADMGCGGPVIMHRDALSLVKPPRGAFK